MSMLPLMEANPSLYDVSALPETYYRYFEVALSFFLFDGRSTGYANNYDFQVYSKLAGGALDKSLSTNTTSILQGELLLVKTNIKCYTSQHCRFS